MFKSLLFTTLLIPFSASAATVAEINEELTQVGISQSQCHDNAISNQDMIACEMGTAEELDVILNREYKYLLNSEMVNGYNEDKDVLVERIRESQRNWLKFKDSNCMWEAASMLNGSGEPLLYLGCDNRMTKERIVELVKSYNDSL